MNVLFMNIDELCVHNGISIYALCKNIGIRGSVLSDLKMGRKAGLSTDTLSKIANYFNVSVDYLLGNETQKEPTTNSDELDINTLEYALYGEARELDEDEKQQLLELAKLMRKKRGGSAD